MRVDVHTHVWPDRIADVVLDNLVDLLGIPAIGLNTVDSLKAHMRASGVDKSVVLGVVDRPDQVTRANDWLISIQDEMLVPFGAMHPDLEDKAAEGPAVAGEWHQRYQAPPHDELFLPQTIPRCSRSTRKWGRT